MGLFHILPADAWERAQREGAYRPVSLETEGFIHFSHDRQWLRVANTRFRGRRDLVLLSVRADRLVAELRIEEADGDRFPHLYGPLNLDAVVDALPLPCDAGGAIGIPDALLPWRHYFEPPLSS